jgi:AcrR family transcriptional regulator
MRQKRATPQKRLAILDAAARAISEHGYHGMTLRALATATGQSLANFYNYFDSKEDVLYELQRTSFESMIAAAREAVAAADTANEELFAFLLQHVRYVAEHPDVLRVLVHEARALPRDKRSSMRRLKERYYEILRDIVAELYREGCGAAAEDDLELEHITYAIFGMVNWLYGWYDPSRHGAPARVARSLHSLAVSGLAGGRTTHATRGRSSVERRVRAPRAAPFFDPRVTAR